MATRFYLPSTGAAAVSPAFAAWDETAAAGARLRCVTTRIASAAASVAVAKGTGATRALVRQYVSDPITAQTIAAGTVTGQIRALESAANDNLDLVPLSIRVFSNDGSTLRGTILALGDYAPALEFATALTNRRIADGDATSAVVCQAGDRIVIELGIKNSAAGSSVNGSLSFGDDNATDLPANTTTTTANNPWVELSSTITFANPAVAAPGTGALTFQGFAPTVAVTENVVASPGTGSLVFTGFAPTVEVAPLGVAVTPGTGALTFQGFAPTVAVSDHRVATPGAGAVVFTGFAPTVAVTNHQTATPGTGALTFQGFAPTVAVSDHRVAAPGTGALALTGFAPTVVASDHQRVTPGTAALTFQGFAPTVVISAARVVTPGTGSLILTGFAPTVAVSEHRTVAPGTGSLTFQGFAPSVVASDHQSVTPGTAALVFQGFAPTVWVSSPAVVVPGTGALVFQGFAPTVAIAPEVPSVVLDGSTTVYPQLEGALSVVTVPPDAPALLTLPLAGELRIFPRLAGALTITPE